MLASERLKVKIRVPRSFLCLIVRVIIRVKVRVRERVRARVSVRIKVRFSLGQV